jgi:hypothetical protein
MHFHDLRHEATSRLAESGLFTLVELQAITGHRDTRMLLRYSHLCARKLAEKMDRANTGLVKEYIHRGRKRRVVDSFGPDVVIGKRSARVSVATKAVGQHEPNVISFPSRQVR